MDTALQTRVAPTTATPAPWGRVRRSRHVADRALKIVCTLFTILGATVLGELEVLPEPLLLRLAAHALGEVVRLGGDLIGGGLRGGRDPVRQLVR